ncbi:MAG: type II toxin-antitoxin system RelE/ParE family toxin [Lysobacterales bacterium]
MRLDWSLIALIDFEEAQSWISEEGPSAAQSVASRIWHASLRLMEQPYMGRTGLEPGTRHLVVQRTPCLIVYRVTHEAVEIVRVWHGRLDEMRGTT